MELKSGHRVRPGAEEAAKFLQPHVQTFLKKILMGAGTYCLQLWKHAGKMRHKRLDEESNMRDKVGHTVQVEPRVDRTSVSALSAFETIIR